jgi:hypothetical protein
MLGRLGSLLDVHECCVDFEHVCKVLGAPRSEVVAANTENKGNLALMGTNTFALRVLERPSLPDGSDARVDLQCLSNLDYALSSVGAITISILPAESIVVEAAIHKHNNCQRLSMGTNTFALRVLERSRLPDESDAGVNLHCLRNSDYALSGIGALEICIHPAESIPVEAAIHKHNHCQRLSTGADAKCVCTMHGNSLERLGCCI